jgi:dUTP pyrophosphatase
MSHIYIPFVQSKLEQYQLSPSTPGSAAVDLISTDVVKEGSIATYYTGLMMAIPEGYAGLILPRSSISGRNLMLANTIGLIDSDYRGEVKIKMMPIDSSKQVEWYQVGDRLAQLLIIPIIVPIYNRQSFLVPTQRGDGGFGSTNK